MTTGATLAEVSSVLKASGAVSVHVVTVARG
jgi:predicted amidophosphoribosyltransferase